MRARWGSCTRGCRARLHLEEQDRRAVVRAWSRTADLADVVGQTHARFAVEVAAAGAHHLTLTGPPGVGKTMLAQRLPGLLPELSHSESLEVTAIHSVAGLLSGDTPLITRPPFVAPHHTSSVAALVGGGTGMARPGCRQPRASRCPLPRRIRRDRQQRIGSAANPVWRTARFGWRGATEWRGTRRAFSWCWRPTRARAHHPTLASASAPRSRSAGIWASCRARCLTASTYVSSCLERGQVPLRPRRANRPRMYGDG